MKRNRAVSAEINFLLPCICHCKGCDPQILDRRSPYAQHPGWQPQSRSAPGFEKRRQRLHLGGAGFAHDRSCSRVRAGCLLFCFYVSFRLLCHFAHLIHLGEDSVGVRCLLQYLRLRIVTIVDHGQIPPQLFEQEDELGGLLLG